MTRLWVVIAGLFGLVVPIWTLNWYAPQDNFARVLIGLIVVGLVAGVFELFRRGQRVDELRDALPGLEGAAEGLEGRL
jgi:F0F1-type ATP synthase assembly protein I